MTQSEAVLTTLAELSVTTPEKLQVRLQRSICWQRALKRTSVVDAGGFELGARVKIYIF